MSSLCASTESVPNMLDVASMLQFLHMGADLLDVVGNARANMQFDFLRCLINRYEPNEALNNRSSHSYASCSGMKLCLLRC